MGVSRTPSETNVENCSKNCPILVLICWDSIPCVFCLYIQLYVIKSCHYDLSDVSDDFPTKRKNCMGDGNSIQFLFFIFNFAKAPTKWVDVAASFQLGCY